MRNPTQLIIRGSILLLLLLVVVLGIGVLRKTRLDTSSRELAVDASQTFLAGDASQLIANAHPELLQQMSNTSLLRYMQSIQRLLGPLQRLESITGSSEVPLLFFSKRIPTANYTLNLAFPGESTEAVMALRYEQDQWQITQFIVQSPRLFN